MSIWSVTKQIFHPSWRGTFGYEPITPLDDLRRAKEQLTQKKILKGISPEGYAHQVLSHNITTEDQHIVFSRHLKRAKIYLFFLSVSLLSIIGFGVGAILGYSPVTYPIIAMTCALQFFRLTLIELQRSKQIACGCCFPIRLLITSPKNLTNFYEGVYIRKRLAYKALPLTGRVLEELRKSEQDFYNQAPGHNNEH